ncbi:hypothetical protein K523DRAFT_358690 [Schizophyllum commune Tattone D]|nr:hypothetical protein K523DRAFT_358690 [Schizophyllum commune Tattone D]
MSDRVAIQTGVCPYFLSLPITALATPFVYLLGLDGGHADFSIPDLARLVRKGPAAA